MLNNKADVAEERIARTFSGFAESVDVQRISLTRFVTGRNCNGSLHRCLLASRKCTNKETVLDSCFRREYSSHLRTGI